jgi:hypothetical protein
LARYEDQLVSFDTPSDWSDKSLVSFSAPTQSSPLAPNVVMTKDRLAPPLRDLESYADHQLVQLARQLEGLDLEERARTRVSGCDAIALRFSWKGPAGVIAQQLIMVQHGQTIVSFATSTMKADAETQAPLFAQIVASIRLAARPS